MYRKSIAYIALITAFMAIIQCVTAAYYMDTTFDEYFHWGWNHELYTNHKTTRENISNYRSTTPILLLNVVFFENFKHIYIPRASEYFIRRIPNILWLLGIFILSYKLTLYAAGKNAAWLAVLFCALDANLLTHSALLTVDTSFAFATLLFCWAVYKAVIHPGIIYSAFFGVVLAFAFASKFSAAFLCVALAFFPLLYTHIPKIKFRYFYYQSI